MRVAGSVTDPDNSENKEKLQSFREITVGIKTTKDRAEKLALLLSSLSYYNFYEVIVVDDYPDTKKERIYKRYGEVLPLNIIYTDEDVGLAAGRNIIIDNLETEYLLLLDDDMEVLAGIDFLINALKSDSKLGAVSGILVENGRVFAAANNLKVRGKYLYKYTPNIVRYNKIDSSLVFYFDMIPNAALFRKEVFDDYLWDPEYKIGYEHVDFFFAHKTQIGEWRFGLTIQTLIGHHPGGSKKYMRLRRSRSRLKRSREYFLRKWGLKDVINASYPFIDTKPKLLNYIVKKIKGGLPPMLASIIQNLERLLIGD